MSNPESEKAIEEFLEGGPRAEEWRAMRQALEGRLSGLHREREQSDPEQRAGLDKQIAALKRQVTTLETEEAVTRFVEDQIKISLARADIEEEAGEA